MNIVKAHNNFLAILLLALMALVMLPGCSTTEEESSDSDSGSCEEQCGGDPNCIETCIQNLPI